jgi:hypothetical protein
VTVKVSASAERSRSTTWRYKIFRLFKDAGHNAHVEAPEQIWKLLADRP